MKTLTTFFSVIAIFIFSINNLSATISPRYPAHSVFSSEDYLMWGRESSSNDLKGTVFIKQGVTEWVLTASDGRSGDRFGHSVSIDGN